MLQFSAMLILASNSPRRKQLLALGGWPFRVQAAEIDERPLPDEAPDDYVLRLAESKARAVASQVEADDVVIAADTTVADGMTILGKPADPRQAIEMLTRLRGRTHRVYTGIAVLRASHGLLLTDLGITEVPMREYSDEEMGAYVASGDPLDKAGAYAIQHTGFHPVETLSGCFANVMGLPLCHLTRTLRKLGIPSQPGVAQACQNELGYTCPVFEQILQE
jgi:MAF protein